MFFSGVILVFWVGLAWFSVFVYIIFLVFLEKIIKGGVFLVVASSVDSTFLRTYFYRNMQETYREGERERAS